MAYARGPRPLAIEPFPEDQATQVAHVQPAVVEAAAEEGAAEQSLDVVVHLERGVVARALARGKNISSMIGFVTAA
jgi:hypothetical protein